MNRDLDMSDVHADANRMAEAHAIDVNRARERQLEDKAALPEALRIISQYLAGTLTLGDLIIRLQLLIDTIAYCPFCDQARKVLSEGVTNSSDPTAFYRLECGHKVI